MDLQNRVCVVTGGGSGIGAAGVRSFARAGARVVVADRNGEAAAAVAAETGGVAVTVEVGDDRSVDRLVAETLTRHGRIDVLCPPPCRTETTPIAMPRPRGARRPTPRARALRQQECRPGRLPRFEIAMRPRRVAPERVGLPRLAHDCTRAHEREELVRHCDEIFAPPGVRSQASVARRRASPSPPAAKDRTAARGPTRCRSSRTSRAGRGSRATPGTSPSRPRRRRPARPRHA
jgi:short chain dehydrogenase